MGRLVSVTRRAAPPITPSPAPIVPRTIAPSGDRAVRLFLFFWLVGMLIVAGGVFIAWESETRYRLPALTIGAALAAIAALLAVWVIGPERHRPGDPSAM